MLLTFSFNSHDQNLALEFLYEVPETKGLFVIFSFAFFNKPIDLIFFKRENDFLPNYFKNSKNLGFFSILDRYEKRLN